MLHGAAYREPDDKRGCASDDLNLFVFIVYYKD